MAALTWREVSAPNFGSSNELIRSADASMNRAMGGLSDTIKNLQVEQQLGADNSLLAKTMQIQDPNQLRQALTSGSLLQGVNLAKVDPRVLETVNGRVGQLLNQAATQQGIDSSKQAMDTNQYKQNRLVTENTAEDAARGELARSLGLSGSLANLPTADQQGIAKTRSGLVSDRLNQQGTSLMNEARAFNNSTTKRDDAATQNAVGKVNDLVANNATIDDLRRNFGETQFGSPQEQSVALQQLERVVGQKLYPPIDAATPTSGGRAQQGSAPAGSGGSGGASSPIAQAALQDIGRYTSQRDAVGVVADIEKNLDNTSSAPEVSKLIAESIPGAVQGDINTMITDAQSRYPDLSAADIGSAISRSTTGNFFGSTSVGDVGVDRSRFNAMLDSISTGKADYNSIENKRARAAGAAVSKADEKLSDARTNLAQVNQRANSQPGIDTSAAEERVERMEQALLDAAERAREFTPDRKKPATENERKRPERNRAFKRPDR